jgi:LacI family transcriptional regulator
MQERITLMGLSIKQIAEIAGVSRGTVDRALNDREGINPQIKARILAIADEMGYKTNRAGRMLGICRNPLRIGIQMPSVGNDFFDDVRQGIEQAAAELADFGLNLSVLVMKGFSVSTQVEQIRALMAEGINGLAFTPIDHPEITALLDELAGVGLPVICFNSDITHGPHLSYIGNDYVHSGRIAAGLYGLLSSGQHLQTLIITGSTQILGHNQRIHGFNQVVRQYYPTVSILDIQENQDDEVLSYQLVRAALQRWPGMNALYLTAGGVAGACRALQECAGDRLIRLICFDQTHGTEQYLRRGLITAAIGQEPYRQGYESIKRLFDFLLDGTPPPARILTRNEILIREHLLPDSPADQ